jgi:hypothetical protein
VPLFIDISGRSGLLVVVFHTGEVRVRNPLPPQPAIATRRNRPAADTRIAAEHARFRGTRVVNRRRPAAASPEHWYLIGTSESPKTTKPRCQSEVSEWAILGSNQ